MNDYFEPLTHLNLIPDYGFAWPCCLGHVQLRNIMALQRDGQGGKKEKTLGASHGTLFYLQRDVADPWLAVVVVAVSVLMAVVH
jgi:hypothetical protein